MYVLERSSTELGLFTELGGVPRKYFGPMQRRIHTQKSLQMESQTSWDPACKSLLGQGPVATMPGRSISGSFVSMKADGFQRGLHSINLYSWEPASRMGTRTHHLAHFGGSLSAHVCNCPGPTRTHVQLLTVWGLFHSAVLAKSACRGRRIPAGPGVWTPKQSLGKAPNNKWGNPRADTVPEDSASSCRMAPFRFETAWG